MKHSEKINKSLFKIYPNSGINKTAFSPSELRELFNADHITNSSDYHDNRVYLTDKGKAYVEELPPQKLCGKILKWVKGNFLELIAIIISIIALLKS